MWMTRKLEVLTFVVAVVAAEAAAAVVVVENS
jgi:hypothetical protein